MAADTLGASVADAMIAKMLTQENLTRILNNGAIGAGQIGVPNMQRLSEIDTSTIIQVLNRLSPVKPVEFMVLLGETESAGGASLHFEGKGMGGNSPEYNCRLQPPKCWLKASSTAKAGKVER